jgi:hypothetical protein
MRRVTSEPASASSGTSLRRRAGNFVVALAAALTALTACGTNASPARPSSTSDTPAPAAPGRTAASRHCVDDTHTRTISPAAATAVLYLPPLKLTGALDSPPTLYEETSGCQPGPDPVWYRADDQGTVLSTYSVRGPDYVNGFAGSKNRANLSPPAQTVDVLGAKGFLYQSQLFWTKADGTQWMAQTSGAPADVVTAARTTAFIGTRVDTTRTPAGFTTLLGSLGGPAPNGKTTVARWYFNHIGTGPGTEFFVSEIGDEPFGGAPGQHPVSINGQPGWLGVVPGGVNLTWRVADGVKIQYSGSGSAALALDIARATERIRPDDPRLS